MLDDLVATARRSWHDCSDDQCATLRNVLWAEICDRKLDRLTGGKGKSGRRPSILFFRRHDVRFRIRRMRFLARRLAEDVEPSGAVARAATDAMRNSIYASLARYFELETSEYLGGEVGEAAKSALTSRGLSLTFCRPASPLSRSMPKPTMLLDAMMALPEEARRSLLFGYLGYILYDLATLPLLQGEGLDEFDPIKVDRISPEDARSIRDGGAAATLKGIEFNNFGAFFSRAYRENDYLWGRLHGLDRLVDIVISSLPASSTIDAAKIQALKKRAFTAILDQEQHRLGRVQPLIAELRGEIERIGVADSQSL